MQVVFLNALLTGGALAVICALTGAFGASAVSTQNRFHPGFVRRWLHRLAYAAVLTAVGTLLAFSVALLLQTQAFATLPHPFTGALGAAIWLAGFEAFGFGYRFARRRRMLRALDSGIAVGLH